MQFKIHVSTEQKQTKNKRFMALSSNNFVTSNNKKTIELGLCAFIITCLTNLVALSMSVHNTPPMGLVFMLLCESVCTQYPSPVGLCTLPLPWIR